MPPPGRPKACAGSPCSPRPAPRPPQGLGPPVGPTGYCQPFPGPGPPVPQKKGSGRTLSTAQPQNPRNAARPPGAGHVGLGTSELRGRGGWCPARIARGTVLAFPPGPCGPGSEAEASGLCLAGSRGRRVSSDGGGLPDAGIRAVLVPRARAGPPQPQGSPQGPPPSSASASRSGDGCGDPDSASGGVGSRADLWDPTGVLPASPGGLSPGQCPRPGQPAPPVRRAPLQGPGLWGLRRGSFLSSLSLLPWASCLAGPSRPPRPRPRQRRSRLGV